MKNKIICLTILLGISLSSCSYQNMVKKPQPSSSTNIINNSILNSSTSSIERVPHLPNNGLGLGENDFYDAYSDYYSDEYVLNNINNLSEETKEDQLLKEKLLNIYHTFDENIIHQENDYTGMFEGYNVINILSETLELRFADPKLTPNIYEFIDHSLYFKNYYVSEFQEGATCNTEFMSHAGLYPVVSTAWSGNMCQNEKTTKNIFKFALPAQLRANGYDTYYFHLGHRNFYNRKNFIPNFGFDQNNIKFINDIGYNDYVTDDKLVDFFKRYVNFEEKFYVSNLTYSMHGAYEENSLGVTVERKERVEKALGLTEEYFREENMLQVFYYLQKLTYFDDMLGLLKNLLDEKGVLDKTIICIYRDHSPYMMSTPQYTKYLDLVHPELNIYDNLVERYNHPLFIYNPQINSRKDIRSAGSSEDLAPTFLNLLGLGIDKASYRYFMGYDMLSDSTCAFVSKQTNSNTNDLVIDSNHNILEYYGEDTYKGDPTRLEYLNAYLERCEFFIDLMKDIADTNYFSYYNYKVEPF